VKTAPASKPRPAASAPRTTPVRPPTTKPQVIVERAGAGTKRVVAAASSGNARSIGLAALALLALVLASGTLLNLVARPTGQWRKA
jgi:hypothetical protein